MTIKPIDIDTFEEFWGSGFGKLEYEIISRNIVIISKKFKEWKPFSWEEYKENCNHNVNDKEQTLLNKMVDKDFLEKDNDKYKITNKFIEALMKFVKLEKE